MTDRPDAAALDARYEELLVRGRAANPTIDIGRPTRARTWRAVQLLFRVVRLRYAVDSRGHEQVAPDRPAIIVSNHQSALDPVLATCRQSWRIFAFTKAEAFEGRSGILFRLWGQVPLRRGDDASTDWALEMCSFALADGKMIGLYPEGTRGPSRSALYRLHQRVLVPIIVANPDVPVHASAISYPPGGRLRKKALVRFSEPLPIDARTMTPDEITAVVRDRILELGGFEYVDVPAFVAKARAARAARAADGGS